MRITEMVVSAALLMLVAGHAVAAGPATLEITVPSDPVRVGDRVPIRVAARGGEDLLWGELRVTVEPDGPWVVVEAPREIEGARPPVWELVLAPMEIEGIALPAIIATARDLSGARHEVTADEMPSVTVRSVLPEGDEVEPVPLRDPVGVSGFPWEWVVPLAVPVMAMAAGLAWWGRRRRSALGPGEIPALAPLTELETLLDQLRDRVGREPAEGICDRLAAGLRHYLERMSDEPAEDMTSFELRLMARRLGWSESVQRGLGEVMAVADSVRFGRVPAGEARLLSAVDLAGNVAGDLDHQLEASTENDEAGEAVG